VGLRSFRIRQYEVHTVVVLVGVVGTAKQRRVRWGAVDMITLVRRQLRKILEGARRDRRCLGGVGLIGLTKGSAGALGSHRKRPQRAYLTGYQHQLNNLTCGYAPKSRNWGCARPRNRCPRFRNRHLQHGGWYLSSK
jgi:hypothetical protein